MYLYVNILIQPNAYTRVFGLEGYCLLKQLTPLAVVEVLLALEHATIFSTKLGISQGVVGGRTKPHVATFALVPQNCDADHVWPAFNFAIQ